MTSMREHVIETSPHGGPLPWHQVLVCDQIDRFLKNDISNLAILMPIQHGKSFVVSDRVPNLILGRSPKSHVGLFAYGQTLTTRAINANRLTMQSDYWQSKYGWSVGKATQTELLLECPNQDGRYSLVGAPIGGSIAGHSVDIAVVDDFLRNRADALSPTIRATIEGNYYSVISPRSKKILLTGTPWHLNDLAMTVLRQARTNKATRQWTVLCLAARNREGKDSYIEDTATGERQYLKPYDVLWPEVHPDSDLTEIEATIPAPLWHALYMCRPSQGSDTLFPRDKWGVLRPSAPIQINWAWDFSSGKSAASNDYTVGCCVGLMDTGRFAVLDVFRGKPHYPTMRQLVAQKWLQTYERYGLMANVFIEDASAGQQILQEFEQLNLRCDTAIKPIAVLPTRNKQIRAEAIASAQNNGTVDLPEDAIWREDFVRELEEFPLGANDDQLDAYVWAQAGFVRGEGFFKVPTDVETGVVVYDPIAHGSSVEDELGFELKGPIKNWQIRRILEEDDRPHLM